MLAVRRLLAHRSFAALLCAAALMLKLLVPGGYMIGSDHGRVTINLCSGIASQPLTMGMLAMHGDAPGHGKLPGHGKSQGHGKSHDHGKAEMPCAFSGLSAASLGAVDPIQLAGLIVFVMAVGLAPAMLPVILRQGYLRPPLRGPPAFR